MSTINTILRRSRLLILLPSLSLAAGCTTDITDPGEEEFELFLGRIQPSNLVGNAHPEASAVAIGDTLTVHINTFGNSCVSKGVLELELDRKGRRLTVSPFDRVQVTSRICLDIRQTFQYADTLELPPGAGQWSSVVPAAVFHERVSSP